MASQLLEFLEGRNEKAQGLDWAAKKRDWVDAVPVLYSTIRSLLKTSTDKGIVTIREVSIEVTEDFIGTYTLPELRLTVGADRVSFTPIGANVVGALGRVDMKGDRDQFALLWTGGNDWQVVVQRVPDLILIPLDEESLLDCLQRVMAP